MDHLKLMPDDNNTNSLLAMSLIHAIWECHTYVWILISSFRNKSNIFLYFRYVFHIKFDLLISFNKKLAMVIIQQSTITLYLYFPIFWTLPLLPYLNANLTICFEKLAWSLCGLIQIVITMKDGECPSPKAMAKQVLCYLEENGYLQA